MFEVLALGEWERLEGQLLGLGALEQSGEAIDERVVRGRRFAVVLQVAAGDVEARLLPVTRERGVALAVELLATEDEGAVERWRLGRGGR